MTPVTFRARKHSRFCIQDQSFSNLEKGTMKLQVNGAKLTGLWAIYSIIAHQLWLGWYLGHWFEMRDPHKIPTQSNTSTRKLERNVLTNHTMLYCCSSYGSSLLVDRRCDSSFRAYFVQFWCRHTVMAYQFAERACIRISLFFGYLRLSLAVASALPLPKKNPWTQVTSTSLGLFWIVVNLTSTVE